MNFTCSNCNKEEVEIDQNEFVCKGKLEDWMITREKDREYENQEIMNGDIAYYYFDGMYEETIRGNKNAAGKARSICRECINKSIDDTFEEKDPHYCDGVYLSFNRDVINSNREIKCCHGEYVAERIMRVKFKIENAKEFIKIYKTGGVIKTNEKNNSYEKGHLIFLNKDNNKIATYLGIEEYVNNRWHMKK